MEDAKRVEGELSEGEQDLIDCVARCVAEKERPVAFLLGSALTMPAGPGHPGVPGVRAVVEMIRAELRPRADAALEEAVAAGSFTAAYQKGFAALRRRARQDGVNRLIRRAVLEAHEPLGPELQAKVLAGHPREHGEACEGLLEDPSGWSLRPSVAALGEILRLDAKAFPWVLTTNFDPLIEVAVTRAGGVPRRSVLHRDGNPERHGGAGTHVVYVHGYWFGTDTLHTGEELWKERPQLRETLKRWIEKSLLVVLGYGGWNDVLMASLTALARDEGAYPEIAWGFYKEREAHVVRELEAAGGRFQPYEHVDMHRLLPALLERLRADRGLAGASGAGAGAGLRRPEWLGAPYEARLAADAPGMMLLRAERGVVAMSGCEAVLEELETWCEGGGLDVRLVTAPGGFGKTRLLRELCARKSEREWTAGIVDRERVIVGQPAKVEPEVIAWAKSGWPMLLAIDYAETWGRDLEVLLRGLAPYRESSGGIRVVLAARGKAEWWDRLPGAVEGLRDVLERFEAVRRIEALEDVKVAWADAVRGFSEVRGAAARPVEEPPVEVLRAWMKEGVLVLHVAALLAVEGEPLPHGASVEKLFDALLGREAIKHWRPKAELLVGNRVSNVDDVLRTVACVGTLVGPVESREGARALLKRTDGLGGVDEPTLDGLATVFAELYPEVSGRMVELPAVQPDRIGERLVATQVEKKPKLAEVAFVDAGAGMGARALRVLGRAARWQPQVVGRIEEVARRFPRAVVEAWIAVAAEEPWAAGLAMRVEGSLGGLEAVSPDEADALVQPVPLGSVALRGVAALLAVRAVEGIPAREAWAAATEEERAMYARRLLNLGNRQSEVGKREDALESTLEAVALRRDLATRRPEAFKADFAKCLNNLGNRQSEVGKREDALESTLEAVVLWRELVMRRPDTYMPDLAMSLNNLCAVQREMGQRKDALKSAEEAEEYFRALVKDRPDAFRPSLAGSLNNLSAMRSEMGRRDQALASAEEAVGLFRELMKDRPDAFRPNLAMGLITLVATQSEMGQREKALVSASDAVDLYRELATQRMEAFRPDLAKSLVSLGLVQGEVGKREDALASIEEAVRHYRELAKQRPEAFQPDLAMCLSNLSATQSALGQREEALASVKEAVGLYRELAQQGLDALLPGLAGSLNNLSTVQCELGQREEALTSAKEAVDLCRELARETPGTFRPDLARSLSNLGVTQRALGRREEALASVSEVVEHYRKLANEEPDAFRAYLAGSLNNLGAMQMDLGKREEALASAEDAVGICRALVQQEPDAFKPDLAMSLNNLGNWQSELGRREEALASAEEAVVLYQWLFLRVPAAFAQNLIVCLRNYTKRLADLGRSPEDDPVARSAIEALQRAPLLPR